MKFQILERIIEELSSIFSEAHVDRVFPTAANAFVLCLRKQRKNFVLLIAPDRSLPRLHLLSGKPGSTASPHPFLLFLKSRMTGSRLAGIRLLNEDRIVDIRFIRQGAEHHLLFEVMGASTNLVLTDSPGTILAVYYPALLSERSTRTLLPGIRYSLPEKKYPPTLPEQSIEQRAPVSSPVQAATYSANREAELSYERLIRNKKIALRRSSLRSKIKKTMARTERRVNALSTDFDSVQKAEEFRQTGDLILANLKNLEHGLCRAELIGYDGSKTMVALDPKYSPARNAELYFKRYKKARAGRNIITERLTTAREELIFLKDLLVKLETAADEAELDLISGLLEDEGITPGKQKKRIALSSQSIMGAYRSVSFAGWEILIGKSAAGNDYLTTRVAAPEDLWLHAEGLPGSHVVIRNPERRMIPVSVLEKAASLAAFYSKGKGSSKVSVTYALARNVRKPKGAKPGLVVLSERKSIMAVPRE